MKNWHVCRFMIRGCDEEDWSEHWTSSSVSSELVNNLNVQKKNCSNSNSWVPYPREVCQPASSSPQCQKEDWIIDRPCVRRSQISSGERNSTAGRVKVLHLKPCLSERDIEFSSLWWGIFKRIQEGFLIVNLFSEVFSHRAEEDFIHHMFLSDEVF